MEKPEAIKLLHKHFPEFIDSDVELITDGWDTDVLVVNNTWIFRIPRDIEERPLLVTEKELLHILYTEYEIEHIPQYEYMESTGIMGGYKKLNGVFPRREVVSTWTENEKQIFGAALGTFLHKLHKVDISNMERLLRKYDVLADFRMLQKDILELEDAFPTKPLFEHAQLVLADTISLLEVDTIRTLVHRDMNPANLLWDTSAHILNIIDFSDRSVSHPGIDMAYLFEYDDTVRESFITTYGKDADSYLIFARLAYQCIGLRVFRAAMNGSDNVTKEEGIAILTKKLSV